MFSHKKKGSGTMKQYFFFLLLLRAPLIDTQKPHKKENITRKYNSELQRLKVSHKIYYTVYVSVQ